MRDEIPADLEEGRYLINLDSSDHTGTRWTALLVTQPDALYFDSFGMPPPEEIKMKPLVYSTTQVQDLTSIMCGYYVIDFFKSVHNVDSYYDFIFNKYGGSPDENENIIRGTGIQEWLVSKLGDRELHLPVLTKKGIEKASFAGPNTNLEKRIKNLDVNNMIESTRLI